MPEPRLQVCVYTHSIAAYKQVNTRLLQNILTQTVKLTNVTLVIINIDNGIAKIAYTHTDKLLSIRGCWVRR